MKIIKNLPQKTPRVDPTILIYTLGEIAKEYAELKKVKEREKSVRYEIEKKLETLQETVNLFLYEYGKLVNKKFEEREKIISSFLTAFEMACNKSDYKLVEILGHQLADIISKPAINEEDIKGIMHIISSLQYMNFQKSESYDDEEAIPTEIEF